MALTDRQVAFLAAFKECGSIRIASRAAVTCRKNHHRWLTKSEEYAEAFQIAKEEARDNLVAEAIRRAKDGTREPVYWQGKICGYKLKFSDQLLMFLLKALDPAFRDSSGARVNVEVGLPVSQRDVQTEIEEAKQDPNYLKWLRESGLSEVENQRAQLPENGVES